MSSDDFLIVHHDAFFDIELDENIIIRRLVSTVIITPGSRIVSVNFVYVQDGHVLIIPGHYSVDETCTDHDWSSYYEYSISRIGLD